MDISALKKDDYQVWVPFMGDAEVLIQYVSLDSLRRLMTKAMMTKILWDGKPRKNSEVDAVEANRMLGRAAVRGWKNITMENEDYPYSPENCDFLMSHWLEFSRFVNDICIDLQALMEAEKEQKIKNSSLTSGGDSTSRV